MAASETASHGTEGKQPDGVCCRTHQPPWVSRPGSGIVWSAWRAVNQTTPRVLAARQALVLT